MEGKIELSSAPSALPAPPVFGMAGGAKGGETEPRRAINLDDVFSGVFFSPDGDLLDIPSDDEDLVTLASLPSGTEHARAQFAVLNQAASRQAAREVASAPTPAPAPLVMPPSIGESLSQAQAAAATAAAEAAAAQQQANAKAAAAAQAAAVAQAQAQAHAQAQAQKSLLQAQAQAAAPVRSAFPGMPAGGRGVGWAGGLSASMPVQGGAGVPVSAAQPARPVVVQKRQRHKIASAELTEEQRIERRERNREHAKRSRVRKKFLLDSLQRSVNALQAENDLLKGSIRDHLGARGDQLLQQHVPDTDSLVTSNNSNATKILDDPDYSLVKALQTAQQNFVITDATLPDNPIVFASGGFLQLTGYTLSHVLGRNCRFLQGPETDPRAVDKIRNSIVAGEDTSVCLLNYRADGTTFWNQFFVAALRDGEGTVVNYVGVQCKVGDEYAKIVVQEQNKKLESKGSSPSIKAELLASATGSTLQGTLAGASAASGAAAAAAADAGATAAPSPASAGLGPDPGAAAGPGAGVGMALGHLVPGGAGAGTGSAAGGAPGAGPRAEASASGSGPGDGAPAPAAAAQGASAAAAAAAAPEAVVATAAGTAVGGGGGASS